MLVFSLIVVVLSLVYQASCQCLHPKFSTVQGHTGCITVDKSHVVENGVPDALKKEIVDKHNDLRRSLQASNMQKMVWDEEVASIAQRWADNCDFDHDSHRDIPGRFSVGQNLGLGTSTWLDVIQLWYDEIVDFTLGGPNGFERVGHFTQVAWFNSAKIGCGYTQCRNIQSARSNGRLYVCNYAPAGNNGGIDDPYRVSGGECGECPTRCENGLCDCGGKVCENGGTLDLSTCDCSCKSNYQGGICSLNCSIATDVQACGHSFPKDYCLKYSNVPADCPLMCDVCPYGGVGYIDPGSAASKLSNNLLINFLGVTFTSMVILNLYAGS